MQFIKRGNIHLADLGALTNKTLAGIRPVLIIQNDIANKFSPTIIVAPLTSNKNNTKLPSHVSIPKESGLPVDSLILLEQLRTIHKSDIKEKLGQASASIMLEVEDALNLVTSNSKNSNINPAEYKQAYSPEYDLMKIKDMLKGSNYIGNRIKDWVYSGIIGAVIGIVINILVSSLFL